MLLRILAALTITLFLLALFFRYFRHDYGVLFGTWRGYWGQVIVYASTAIGSTVVVTYFML